MDYKIPAEYELGIPYLDEQHAQLVALTDQAQTLLKDDSTIHKLEQLTEILRGIQDYTVYHFTEEEAFMETFSYSRLDAHKKLHADFIKRLEKINGKLSDISPSTQDAVLEELLGYLRNWLFEHILSADKIMAEESLSFAFEDL